MQQNSINLLSSDVLKYLEEICELRGFHIVTVKICLALTTGHLGECNIRVRAGKSEKRFDMGQLEVLFVINKFCPHIFN